MASLRFADLRSRPMEFLDFTSVTLDEFQQLGSPSRWRSKPVWQRGAWMGTADCVLVCRLQELTLPTPEDRRKRNRFMCYYSVAERCSCQSGNSKEGTRWDTSHKPH